MIVYYKLSYVHNLFKSKITWTSLWPEWQGPSEAQLRTGSLCVKSPESANAPGTQCKVM